MTIRLSDALHEGAQSAFYASHDAPAPIRVAPLRGGLATLEGYWLVLRGLARPQRIAWPDPALRWEGDFVLTPELRDRWLDLFGVTDRTRGVPLTFYEPLLVRMGHEMFRRVGANFKNLLYVGWELDVASPDAFSPRIGAPYRLIARLVSIRPCVKRRAIITLDASLVDEAGRRLLTSRDSMLVKGLSARDLEHVMAVTGATESTLGGSLPPARERLDVARAHRFAVPYPEDLGRRFGDLSGDANFLHTNRHVLRLFGHERMFSHGMCTANHVLKLLAHDLGAAVRRFSITFRHPAYLGQTVDVRITGDRFEVCGEAGELIAEGEHRVFGDDGIAAVA